MARVFSRDFKLDVCRRILSGELTRGRVSQEYTLSHGMLDRWLWQFKIKGEDAFKGSWREEGSSEGKEIEELRLALNRALVDVADLEEEIRLLKKKHKDRERLLKAKLVAVQPNPREDQ